MNIVDACNLWYPEILSTYTLPASSSLSISMSTWSSCFASILLRSRQALSVSLQETNTSLMFCRFFSLPSETLLLEDEIHSQDSCHIHSSRNASIYNGYSISIFAGDLCWWIMFVCLNTDLVFSTASSFSLTISLSNWSFFCKTDMQILSADFRGWMMTVLPKECSELCLWIGTHNQQRNIMRNCSYLKFVWHPYIPAFCFILAEVTNKTIKNKEEHEYKQHRKFACMDLSQNFQY